MNICTDPVGEMAEQRAKQAEEKAEYDEQMGKFKGARGMGGAGSIAGSISGSRIGSLAGSDTKRPEKREFHDLHSAATNLRTHCFIQSFVYSPQELQE